MSRPNYHEVNAARRDRAYASADEVLATFRVDTLAHSLPGTKRYRCWNGQNGSYCFQVFEVGTHLFVTGDMYDWVFNLGGRPLIGAAGCLRTPWYLASKLVAVPTGVSLGVFSVELANDFLSASKAENVEAVKEEWAENEDERLFKMLCLQHGVCDDFPVLTEYCYHFHWIHRALWWVVQQENS